MIDFYNEARKIFIEPRVGIDEESESEEDIPEKETEESAPQRQQERGLKTMTQMTNDY